MSYYDNHPRRGLKEPPREIKTEEILERIRKIYKLIGRHHETLKDEDIELLIDAGFDKEDMLDSREEEATRYCKLLTEQYDWMKFEEHVRNPVIRRELEDRLENYDEVFTHKAYKEVLDMIRNQDFDKARQAMETEELPDKKKDRKEPRTPLWRKFLEWL